MLGVVIIVIILIIISCLKIVHEKNIWVVEFLGKYQKTLKPGINILIPFFQRVAEKHSIKEIPLDIPPQVCITNDNVQVTIDGILYLKVDDPVKATYNINNYKFASISIAQTTLRSQIGKVTLDQSFSERKNLNEIIINIISEISSTWGVNITRYEIQDITPSSDVIKSMEAQLVAERQRRADILKSEAERESLINVSIGKKEEKINIADGLKEKYRNEAVGKAEATSIIANAKREGFTAIKEAIKDENAYTIYFIKELEEYFLTIENFLENSHITIVPEKMGEISSLMKIIKGV